MNGQPVIAGVDESDSSLIAVRWAAREAAVRGTRLLLVHAYVWPMLRIPRAFAHMGPADGLHVHADELLRNAEQVARTAAPSVEVETSLVTGFPGTVLAEASRQACCVVLGSRGAGAIGSVLIGSTALELVAHSEAPVVVVRSEPAPEHLLDPVLVAVDGSELTDIAMAFAASLAMRHDVPLLAVHVDSRVKRSSMRSGAGLRLLSKAVAGLREKYPKLRIEERVLSGHLAGVLADASRSASAIVVGSRGAGGFTGMLLGSVAHSVLHHASCPVIVLPHRLVRQNTAP